MVSYRCSVCAVCGKVMEGYESELNNNNLNILNQESSTVIYNDNEDWICEHKDFPFCDCLANYAKRGSTSSISAICTEVSTLSGLNCGYTEENVKKSENHMKKIYSYKPVDLVGSSLGYAIRDSILEVLEEDDENESEVEGAVGGDVKASFAGHLVPINARRASIVMADSRRNSILLQPEPVRVAVFGKDGVGKSALIVRLVTGRFIGEYDPSMEAIYNYQIPLAGHDLPLQVMDTAGTVDVSEEGRERQVSWGEGFMLVFSLTNHSSLAALQHLRRVLVELTPGSPRPLILVGNKADLSHAREVPTKEILDLADLWGCDYYEVSAAEPWDVVVRPFLAIYQAVLESRRG